MFLGGYCTCGNPFVLMVVSWPGLLNIFLQSECNCKHYWSNKWMSEFWVLSYVISYKQYNKLFGEHKYITTLNFKPTYCPTSAGIYPHDSDYKPWSPPSGHWYWVYVDRDTHPYHTHLHTHYIDRNTSLGRWGFWQTFWCQTALGVSWSSIVWCIMFSTALYPDKGNNNVMNMVQESISSNKEDEIDNEFTFDIKIWSQIGKLCKSLLYIRRFLLYSNILDWVINLMLMAISLTCMISF